MNGQMPLRTGLWGFLFVLAVVAAGLRAASTTILHRSASSEQIVAESRAAEKNAESDLAVRLLIKGLFYSDDPQKCVDSAPDVPAVRAYLKGLLELRAGRSTEAEGFFKQAAESAFPLLSARAKIHLEAIRYGSALPNVARIPF